MQTVLGTTPARAGVPKPGAFSGRPQLGVAAPTVVTPMPARAIASPAPALMSAAVVRIGPFLPDGGARRASGDRSQAATG